jgi:hypothetical protein
MFKFLTLCVTFFIVSSINTFASETIFSCKEDYISDYGEHVITSVILDKALNSYRLNIVDHAQLVELYNSLYDLQNESIHSVQVLFKNCSFSKEHEWEINCSKPVSATFFDNMGNSLASIINMNTNSGRFVTEEENKNWFFSSLGLSVNNKFAEIKAQFHPEDNCKNTYK